MQKYNLKNEQHCILQNFVDSSEKARKAKEKVERFYKMNNSAITFLKNCIDSILFLELLKTIKISRRFNTNCSIFHSQYFMPIFLFLLERLGRHHSTMGSQKNSKTTRNDNKSKHNAHKNY